MRRLPDHVALAVSVVAAGVVIFAGPKALVAQADVVPQHPEARPCVERARSTLPPQAPGEAPTVFERHVYYHWDSEGHLVRAQHDSCPDYGAGSACYTSADGRIDQSRLFYYEEGLLRAEVWDFNVDGTYDIANAFFYDDGGNRLRDVTDFGMDQVIERQITYQNDEQGRPVVVDFDYGNDGVVEARVTHHYEGELETGFEEDVAADGVADLSVTYEYDDRGRRTRETQLFTDPSQPDDATAYHYEGDQLSFEEYDHLADGSVETLTRWTYDSQGRPTGWTIELVGESVPPIVETVYGYDCPSPAEESPASPATP